MRTPKKIASRVFRNSMKWFSPFRAGCAVLLYHRVTHLQKQALHMAVSPENFEAQMQVLKSEYTILRLQDIGAALLGQKSLPHRAVAVTFDDGYCDNRWEAKPILEKYEIPATLFVTTGKLDQLTEFWWDDLERLLLVTVNVPQSLSLHFPEGAWQADTKDEAARLKTFHALKNKLQFLTHLEREKILAELCAWAGVPREGRVTHRAMTSDDIKCLEKSGFLQVGAHTENHVVLCAQLHEVQRAEILSSKQKLEALLGHKVEHFAYPYGLPDEHFNHETMKLVQELGFQSACSTKTAVLRQSKRELFQIPRLPIHDWPAEEFRARLKGYFNA